MNLPDSALRLCELGPDDSAVLLALSDAVDWDFTPGDFATAFAGGRLCGHKDAGGRLVSAAGIFGYGPALAWVGIVMVHPAMQRRGLGRAVMQWCHDVRPEPEAVTVLIATTEGERLYEPLGYRTVERVYKAFAPAPIDAAGWSPGEGLRVEPLRVGSVADDVLAHCVALDRAACGGEREAFLRARIAQATQGLLLRDDGGRPRGYLLGVPRESYLTVGPLVAPDARAAAALIAALGAGHRGQLRIDVPCEKADLTGLLPELGFVLDSTPPVMTLDGRPLPGGWPGYYAISAQAFG